MRALDPEGNAWGTPVDISNGSHDIAGLAEVNGLPVIAKSNAAGVSFLRGADSDGTAWDTVLSDNSLPSNGSVYSAANGTPLIASWAVADSLVYNAPRSLLYSARIERGQLERAGVLAVRTHCAGHYGIPGAGYAFAPRRDLYYRVAYASAGLIRADAPARFQMLRGCITAKYYSAVVNSAAGNI